LAEDWRRKGYYRTRVLIPVDEVLESEFGDCLVCLTGGQLNLVRNLLLYAERRSTFVSEYHEGYYLAPTTEEWDALQEVVADLEGNLMDCEQFTKDLQEILDWVRLLSTLPGGTFSEAELEAFPYTDEVADNELTPAEEDACAIAQLWFEWGYQVITEHVLPATRWGFDYLIPAVTAFIATAIGGPVAGMGAWAIAEFVQEILEIFYRGAETNLVNWMDTNKEDIVCVLYPWLIDGAYASTAWAAAYAAVIEPAEDISAGDKLMLNLFMGSWAGSNAALAFEEETEWATSNVQEGYCDDCEEAPVEGNDWIAYSHHNALLPHYEGTDGRIRAIGDVQEKGGLIMVGCIIHTAFAGPHPLWNWPTYSTDIDGESSCPDIVSAGLGWGSMDLEDPPSEKVFVFCNPANIDEADLFATLGEGGEMFHSGVLEKTATCACLTVAHWDWSDADKFEHRMLWGVYRESV